MFDTIWIYDKEGNKVRGVIGIRGVIWYANKFEEVETYCEAISALEKNGLTVNKTYIMV